VSWNAALAVASIVFLAVGVAALVKRAMRPTQAVGVLVVAVAVGAVTGAASSLAGDGAGGVLYTGLIALTCAVGGAAMAVAIVTRRRDPLR
jgi:hypothetical protein